MKVFVGLIALILAGPFAVTSSAADPAGTWRWEHQSLETQETVKNVLTIKMNDGKVIGTYQGEGELVDIIDGKMDGDTLSWAFDIDAEGTSIHVAFSGKISDDDVSGTVKLGDFGEFPWTAKRDATQEDSGSTNPSGIWRWTHDQDGQTIKDVLELVFDGKGAVSGTYHSGDDVHDVENAKIEGNVLSWEFNIDVAGNSLNVAFNGKIEGDDVNGLVTIGELGEFPWTAKRDQGSRTSVAAAEPAQPTVADMLKEMDIPDSVIASVQDWSSLPAHIRVTVESLLQGELDKMKRAKEREKRAAERRERERKKREEEEKKNREAKDDE